MTHVCLGAGTGGTVSGIGKFLKEQNSAVRVVAVDASTSYRATGGHPQPYVAEGIGIDFDAPLIDMSVIDSFMLVSDEQVTGMLKRDLPVPLVCW